MTFDEFQELPESERGDAYKLLNAHDRFLVRISMPPVVGHVKREEVKATPEERKASKKRFEEILKHYHILKDDESLSD